MATELTLPYVRFVRQVSTASGALTGFVARMQEGFELLKLAAWRQASTEPADTAIPINSPIGFVLSDKYDAFKASTTVAGTGAQVCHFGMAAYRFKIPADAIADSTPVQQLLVSVGADKFATSGLKVAVILSNATTPPTDWDLLRAGGEGTTPDATGKFASFGTGTPPVETAGILNSTAPLIANATNKATWVTLDLSAVTVDYAYMYVVVSMFDYTDYLASRQYWVEGAGIVNGASAVVTFAADVTADGAVTVWDGWLKAGGRYYGNVASPYFYQNNFSLLTTGHANGATVDEQLAQYPIVPSVGALTGTTTFTQFDGATGALVGLDTGKKVYGAFSWRIVGGASDAAFTSFRFSEAAVLDLSGKSISLKMSVFVATLDETLAHATVMRPKQTAAGILQYNAFRGEGADPSIMMEYFVSPTWTEVVALTFTRLASFKLGAGKAYTSSDKFAIALTGGGLKCLLITITPEAYSGTIGTDTKATFTPGELLYLQ